MLFQIFLTFLTFSSFAFSEEVPTIQSPDVATFGRWGLWENCSQGQVVTAVQLKVEGKHSVIDDTGLNGIRFFCGRPQQVQQETINGTTVRTVWENVTSSVGLFGHWGHVLNCTTYAVGFDLEVQPPQGQYKDDLAATNLKVICADGKELEGYFNNGHGHTFPNTTYTGVQRCPAGHALCGIKTRVEPYQVLGDDTALNNVAGKCCSLADAIGLPLPISP